MTRPQRFWHTEATPEGLRLADGSTEVMVTWTMMRRVLRQGCPPEPREAGIRISDKAKAFVGNGHFSIQIEGRKGRIIFPLPTLEALLKAQADRQVRQ